MADAASQNVVTTAQPPNFQLPSLQRLMGFANNIVEKPRRFFPGPTVAPQNQFQTGAQQAALDFAQGASAPLASNIIGANQFTTTSVLDPASNPFLQAAAQNAAFPIARNFEQSILPSIRQGAAASGNSGSSRQGIAEGLAAQATADAIQRATTDIFNQGFQSSLDASLKSQALAPSVLGLGVLPAQIQAGVGDALQGQQQAELQGAIDRFNFGQLEPTLRAQDFQNLIGGNFGGTTTSAGTAQGAQPSSFERVLAGGSLGLSLADTLAGTGLFGGATAGQIAPFSTAGGALLSLLFG